ncbi:MAG: AAA family ATPase [Cyclobacteriaceae bacterium]|nr:AAA family ATPase [Cyclobacteriaceae bacterium]
MKRSIYKSLLKWKEETNRKPLLLRGARQIGKTYIVDKLGKNEFRTSITLNFERNPEYKAIFSSYNPTEIIEKIILYTGKQILKGKTLLFLDEIQECPKAIMSLRYFYEEMPEMHIIGAGSLLEFSLQSADYRMPVGRVQYLYMYPLSFSEFLIALSEKPLNDYILNTNNLPKIPNELHVKLIDYVRKYYIIGGMPAVVNKYISTKDVLACQRIQHSILETYQDDFAKYTRKSQLKYVKKVFSVISTLIGQKVVYTNIDSVAKSRDLKAAFELLETAGIIYKVKRTSGAGLPFEASTKENYYKPIFLDIGLMHAINGIYSETIKEEDLTAIYKGAVAEQFVGQELLALSNNYMKASLYYWAREAKNSSAEIDFLLSKNEKIIPVEVKSGKKGTLRSLLLFLETYKARQGIKISQAVYKKEANLLSIPFYAIAQLLKE